MNELKSYVVWDAPTRAFHWINVLAVLGLAGVGLVILNDKALGVSNDGKILLKTLHVWIGYAFVLNLLLRFAWAFAGNRHARWGGMFPGGAGYGAALRGYVAAARAGRPQHWLGHTPPGRLMTGVLFVLLAVQALSGLVLAGTDLFYPPLGGWIADAVAAPGVDPATLVPYAPALYDAAAYESMRAVRAPFVAVHEYGFFVLVGAAALHIGAVVFSELRHGGTLVSAMFSGRKVLPGEPVDAEER